MGRCCSPAWFADKLGDIGVLKSGSTMTGDLGVPTEVYGAGWNGDMTVPTKDAVYDEMETRFKTGGSMPASTTGIVSALGSLRYGRQSRNADGTVSTTDPVLQDIDASGGARTIALGAATDSRLHIIRKADTAANAVLITATTIEGVATWTLQNQGDYVALIGTGTSGAWYVVGASNLGRLQDFRYSAQVNLGAVAATTIWQVPQGRTAVITDAIVRCNAATAITVAATLGIGVAAGEDDVFGAVSLTGLTAVGRIYRFSGGAGVTVAASGLVKAGVDVAATGTSQTAIIDLRGYLL